MDRTEGVMVVDADSVVGRAQDGRTFTRPRQSPVPTGPMYDARPGRCRAVPARFHAAGRALINFGLVVTLAAILVANMPDSVVRSRLLVAAQPYLTAVGLGQNWGVFAPNPRTEVAYVTGHIQFSDGTSSVWSTPARTGLMAYSDYRWRKFGEHVRLDRNRHLWQPFAAYLAHQEGKRGHVPEQVSLMRRWADLQPPGVTPGLGPWRQFVYYTTPVRGAG